MFHFSAVNKLAAMDLPPILKVIFETELKLADSDGYERT
jgi:hypothetical protein